MKRINILETLGLVFLAIALLLSILAYFLSGMNAQILSVSVLILFVSIYIFSYIIRYWLQEKGEEELFKKEKSFELLKLEKDDISSLWAMVTAAGFTFLLPGIIEAGKIYLSWIGLVFLSVGNIIYNLFYLPRHYILIKKQKINDLIKKESKK